MKQQSFTKSITELELGDKIIVPSKELDPPLSESFYEATVVAIKRVRTFGYKAMLLIDGMPDTLQTGDLDLHHKFKLASLEGQDFVWVDLNNIEAGDRITWWQDIVTIKTIGKKGNLWSITVTDPTDGEEKSFDYKESAQLHVKIGEASEEKKQQRMRRIAEHMLPPLSYKANDPPDILANRILRHIQEWTDGSENPTTSQGPIQGFRVESQEGHGGTQKKQGNDLGGGESPEQQGPDQEPKQGPRR